jgi:hypothetical protein
MSNILEFLKSDLAIYWIPLPAIALALVAIFIRIWRGEEWPVAVARGTALGFPIPLAVTYFLMFGFLMFGILVRPFGDWLLLTMAFAPQAYVLLPIGIWLSAAIIRQRDLRPLVFAAIFPIAFFGHLMTVTMVSEVR